MLGYLNNPGETSQVLSHGVYDTGDIGYVDSDGFVYIVGRRGSFIKSFGYKVSPHTVEQVLLSHSEIKFAYVFGRESADAGESIVAVLQPQNEAADTAALRNELTKVCEAHLASYEVPAAFYFLKTLPLGSTGKPDFPAMKRLVYGSE